MSLDIRDDKKEPAPMQLGVPAGSDAETGSHALKVFVSYAREDLAFADQLVAGLELLGFVPMMDRHGITGGEEWQSRLSEMLADADTVVFALSPASASSGICEWEVSETLRLGKRLIPIVVSSMDGVEVPRRLSELNHIFFYDDPQAPGGGFGQGLAKLSLALKYDADWIRDHTRLTRRAKEWIAGGQAPDRLLRGIDIEPAKSWMARRKNDAPEISDNIRIFIEASEQAQLERARAAIQRAEEMEAAQAERAKALAAAEASQLQTAQSQRRAGRLLRVVGILVATTFGITLWQSHKTSKRESVVHESLTQRAIAEQNYDRAIRIALYGLPPPRSLPWTYSSPHLVNQLAEAVALNKLKLSLAGHTDALRMANYSDDGVRIVTASADKTARIWDASNGRIVHVLKGHKRQVNSAYFSPNGGRLVVTASSDGTARIWDTASGKLLHVLDKQQKDLFEARFSPNGQQVVTASLDGNVHLWDVASGRLLREFAGHQQDVRTVRFSPDGKQIVTASSDKTAAIWDVKTGDRKLVLAGHSDSVISAEFSPDGQYVVTAAHDRTAIVWDASTGKMIKPLNGHLGRLYSARFSPSSRFVVTASADRTARVWEVATGQSRALRGHIYPVSDARFSPDNQYVATASSDFSIGLWGAHSGKLLQRYRRHDRDVRHVVFSPDGSSILSAGADFAARVWQFPAVVKEMGRHAGLINSAAFSGDGNFIGTASADHTARIWDRATGKQVQVFKGGHHQAVIGIAFSPDGRHVATSAKDRTAIVWDSQTGMPVGAPKMHGKYVFSMAFSPDSKSLLTASNDHKARLWDTASGKLRLIMEGHEEEIRFSRFSPDGKLIVTGSDDKTARLWDAATGKQLQELSGHDESVVHAAFSPDSRVLATASPDKSVRAWDTATGRHLYTLPNITPSVSNVFFSQSGKEIITISSFVVRLWDAKTQTLLGVAAAGSLPIASADLSPDGRYLVSRSFGKASTELVELKWRKHDSGTIRQSVCRSKIGKQMRFTADDIGDRILRGLKGLEICARSGPLSFSYHQRWFASLAARARAFASGLSE